MKVMVCGSIGFDDISKIRELYEKLSKEGFDVLKHIDKNQMDYSEIKDFREKKELAKTIVEHDLQFVEQADILVAIFNEKASYGTAIEMYVAKEAGKKVILLVQNMIPTPWVVRFSDEIVSNEKELVSLLKKLLKK